MYYPTIWDLGILFGSMGFFMVLFLLFTRSLPVIAIAELRELVHREKGDSP
jgi:molybdopterin-containing oxidoreductase family membrane subunit